MDIGQYLQNAINAEANGLEVSWDKVAKNTAMILVRKINESAKAAQEATTG